MNTIVAASITSLLLAFLGLGVVILSAGMDWGWARVFGTALIVIGLLVGLLGGLIWAAWAVTR